MVVFGVCRGRQLGIGYSAGRKTMERVDEPPPPILLYQAGLGGWE